MNGCYVSCERATCYFFGELIITEELVFLIVANLFFAQRRKLEQLQQLAVVHLSIAMAEAACEFSAAIIFPRVKHMPAQETVIISI